MTKPNEWIEKVETTKPNEWIEKVETTKPNKGIEKSKRNNNYSEIGYSLKLKKHIQGCSQKNETSETTVWNL